MREILDAVQGDRREAGGDRFAGRVRDGPGPRLPRRLPRVALPDDRGADAAGVTIVSTVEVRRPSPAGPVEVHAISFLSDDIIRLRYVEIDGQLRKVLMVVKMRRSTARDIREYEITSEGFVIGERLDGLSRPRPAASRSRGRSIRASCSRPETGRASGPPRV